MIPESLGPSEKVLYRALDEGPKTMDELIAALYIGTDGGPLNARQIVHNCLWRTRRKISRRIKRHTIYTME